jgi:hypothetical protein
MFPTVATLAPLSARLYLAGLAMAALLRHPPASPGERIDQTIARVAELSVAAADAVLAELAQAPAAVVPGDVCDLSADFPPPAA